MQSRKSGIRLRLVTIAFTMAAAFGTGCAPSTPAEPEVLPSKGRIIFDMGHGEIFGAEDTTELGQSQAIARMRQAQYDVVVNQDPITAADLEGASGLVLAGPMSPLAPDEYDAITSFVERGGTVLLTIHVPYPVMAVPAHWGAPVGTEILMSQTPAAGPQAPSVFFADVVAESPLTEGVNQVLVVSGWPVSRVDGGQPLVSTRPDTWLSPAGDQQPEPSADAVFGSYGVIAVADVGRGRVVVVGDDAIFANLAINEGDNARLLDNIIGLMTAATEI